MADFDAMLELSRKASGGAQFLKADTDDKPGFAKQGEKTVTTNLSDTKESIIPIGKVEG
jgi:hypothetical protein